MTKPPCLSHNAPCPFLDLRGRREDKVCCGMPGEPRRLALVRDCPRMDVARGMWRKNARTRFGMETWGNS